MKPAGKLPPIPTPVALRVRQAKMTLLPSLVFVGALMVIAILWRDRIGAPTMVGQAAGGIANLRPHQAGVLAGLTGMELALPVSVSIPSGLLLCPGELGAPSIISAAD